MSKKDRDEALDRVGRELYGEYWIGELKTREWKLGKIRNQELPRDQKKAARVARARFRSAAIDSQFGEVIYWLEHQHAIDCTPAGFDRAKFEKIFGVKFGDMLSATDVRRAAIRKRWQAGNRPGRGGTETWKRFCQAIRDDCKAGYDEKTIQRDVREMFPLRTK